MSSQATSSAPVSILSPDDRAVLERAFAHLERPSLAARMTAIVGQPLELGLKLMPRPWYKRVHRFAEVLMTKALNTAVSSLRHRPEMAHDRFYHALAAASGAAGGYFGIFGLPAELAVSTTVMLRAIADIARSEGEDLDIVESRLACLEVFALGGRTEEDDAADTGYYGLRLALSLPITSATYHVYRHGVAADGAPVLVGLVSKISSRFGVALTQKAALHAIPLVGAASGAAINAAFVHHFQEVARNHFAVRRLERKYGAHVVRAAYQKVA